MKEVVIMIQIAAGTLKYTGPLLVAIFKQKLEGRSQKEIAQRVNRDEAWVSRRVQEAQKHELVKVEEEERWGWHPTYGTHAKWKVYTVRLTKKGLDAVKTLLNLDPVVKQCPHCRTLLDATGYSGLVKCSVCGHGLYVEGIETLDDYLDELFDDWKLATPREGPPLMPRWLAKQLWPNGWLT